MKKLGSFFQVLAHLLFGFYIFILRFVETLQYDIKKGEIVLDVGCGNRPFLRSNIIMDKYVYDDTERKNTGKLCPPPNKRMIIGNCTNLPFKDKSVDFLYSRDLIEHVENIESFLTEVQRVAKRGVLIAPSSLCESFIPEPFHCWLVSKVGDKLVFCGKAESVYEHPVANFTSMIYSTKKAAVFIFFMFYYHKFFQVVYCWNNNIKYEVINRPKVTKISAKNGLSKEPLVVSFEEKIKKKIWGFASIFFS